MKKTFYYLMFFAGAAVVNAQTFVDTEPQTKKILLEKFTGINCGACPGGDATISDLHDLYGDNFSVFAHHTFSTSPGDIIYEISESPSIATQSNATGYPAGNVNRTVFTDYSQNPGGSAMGRQDWQAAADLELAEDAYVNIAAKFKHDVEFNKFVVEVEIYYTGTPSADQRLNVGIVQNKVLGPQAGGGAGDEYEHNHMLRDLITGQWGEVLTGAAQNQFISKTYEFAIPAAYGPVATIPEDMEIVAFITEGQTTVANSTHAKPVKFVHYGLNPGIRNKGVSLCGTDLVPKVELFNFGNTDINEIEFKYTLNGIDYNHTWNGSISTFNDEVISLPSVAFSSLPSNTYKVEIESVNGSGTDENLNNNSFEITFDESVEVNAYSYLEIKLDGYGSDITWKLTDEDGTEHYTGGPYEDGTVDLIQQDFNLSDDKCYRFEITDSEGNGLEGGQNSTGTFYPDGYYKFVSGSYTKENSAFGSEDQNMFSINEETIGVSEIEFGKLNISPNPSGARTQFDFDIVVKNPSTIEYAITDNLGRTVIVHQVSGDTGKNRISVNHNLTAGVYYLNVTADKQVSRAKIIIE